MSQTRWMGIDLGDARVGLSLSDPELTLAHPAGNIEVGGDYFQALDAVVEQAEHDSVDHIVVGYPLLLNGKEGPSAKKARRWSQNLRNRLEMLASKGQLRLVHVPVVELKDERLTTVTAHRQLHEAGVGSRMHRAKVDQQSAVILLQEALDELARDQRSNIG